MTFCVRLIEI